MQGGYKLTNTTHETADLSIIDEIHTYRVRDAGSRRGEAKEYGSAQLAQACFGSGGTSCIGATTQ